MSDDLDTLSFPDIDFVFVSDCPESPLSDPDATGSEFVSDDLDVEGLSFPFFDNVVESLVSRHLAASEFDDDLVPELSDFDTEFSDPDSSVINWHAAALRTLETAPAALAEDTDTEEVFSEVEAGEAATYAGAMDE